MVNLAPAARVLEGWKCVRPTFKSRTTSMRTPKEEPPSSLLSPVLDVMPGAEEHTGESGCSEAFAEVGCLPDRWVLTSGGKKDVIKDQLHRMNKTVELNPLVYTSTVIISCVKPN